MVLAIDAAATEFCEDGEYVFRWSTGERRDATGMIEFWEQWSRKYPIRSLEDPLEENDWGGWKALTDRIGDRVQLVGDDLFVTHPTRLARGIDEGIANAILIKVNQIGTLSETLEAMRLARDAGYRSVVSHRSGETEDTFIADLAVGHRGGTDQDGQRQPDRPGGEVQPAPTDRGGAGCAGELSGEDAVGWLKKAFLPGALLIAGYWAVFGGEHTVPEVRRARIESAQEAVEVARLEAEIDSPRRPRRLAGE